MSATKILVDDYLLFKNETTQKTQAAEILTHKMNTRLENLELESQTLIEQCLNQITILQNEECKKKDYWKKKLAYIEIVRETYLALHGIERKITFVQSVLKLFDKEIEEQQLTFSTEMIHQRISILSRNIAQRIATSEALDKINPLDLRGSRHYQLRPFFRKLKELIKKEKEFDQKQHTVTNKEDYLAAKQQISLMRLEMQDLGMGYVKGHLTLEEFKSKTKGCIHNPKARTIIDKHRSHPYIAEFLVLLKNLLSIIACAIPFILNGGFFKKTPTQTSQILNNIDNNIESLTIISP